MEIENARSTATKLLALLLERQPNMLDAQSGVGIGNGADVAKFCSDFVEAYATYLVNRSK
ncbi:hypothetical protein [Cupriavidus sp. BIC8F]|uniref:hypothetical protein n=1 Tax=Cupriavidus sp. BIC8F TaxID=3079014 RepID=UPI002916F8E9|nr:hypothetical protein [Cupriavidus sp. BIC8F]